MTILVGIKCRDGIVIGSDSSATSVMGKTPIIEQPTKKLQIIDDKIIIAGCGQVGLGQRFCGQIEQGWKDKVFATLRCIPMATKMCELAKIDFASTQVLQGGYGALVAFPADHGLHLCEFAISDFQPELKTEDIWYSSMGSGQLIADPFLGFMRNVFWSDGIPTLQLGIFIATWTINHAIEVNAGGIKGPIQLAILKTEKTGPVARMLTADEILEHTENIEAATTKLREYKEKLAGHSTEGIQDVPKL